MNTNNEQVKFNSYNGNARVASISFDSLIYKFEGQDDMFDPADRNIMCQYVGKIGRVESNSFNQYTGTTDTTEIKFENGYSMIVDTDGLVVTDEDVTWAEFLPDYQKKGKFGYRGLTNEEKKFADLAILSMIHGRVDFKADNVLANAIGLAMRRTNDYACEWTEPNDD
jgi:hypothetical protein